jgi:hypothetical protein
MTFLAKVKPLERANLLQSMAEDVLTLIRQFEDDARVSSMQSFHCLKTLLKEQCVITPSNDGVSVEMIELKNPKEVPSDSLQNPSDPDAGYSGHKGKGYQVQICETFQPEDSEYKHLSLILHAKTESAAIHASYAVKPATPDLKEKGAEPWGNVG